MEPGLLFKQFGKFDQYIDDTQLSNGIDGNDNNSVGPGYYDSLVNNSTDGAWFEFEYEFVVQTPSPLPGNAWVRFQNLIQSVDYGEQVDILYSNGQNHTSNFSGKLYFQLKTAEGVQMIFFTGNGNPAWSVQNCTMSLREIKVNFNAAP